MQEKQKETSGSVKEDLGSLREYYRGGRPGEKIWEEKGTKALVRKMPFLGGTVLIHCMERV